MLPHNNNFYIPVGVNKHQFPALKVALKIPPMSLEELQLIQVDDMTSKRVFYGVEYTCQIMRPGKKKRSQGEQDT